MKYVYPAFFEKAEDGYSVTFPDFDGAFTCGKDLAEAIYMAEDCLGLVLFGMEEDKQEYPQPMDIETLSFDSAAFYNYVAVDMVEYKRKLSDKPVKKMVYIPKGLNDQAEAQGVNFSQVLRSALISTLGASTL